MNLKRKILLFSLIFVGLVSLQFNHIAFAQLPSAVCSLGDIYTDADGKVIISGTVSIANTYSGPRTVSIDLSDTTGLSTGVSNQVGNQDSITASYTILNVPSGTYRIYLAGHVSTDSNYDCLQETGFTITRSAPPPPPPPTPATINVSSNVYTNWVISGPNNFSGSGTSASYSGGAGTYSITADDLYCYSKSINSSTQSVGEGGTITFSITYSNSCPPPSPPPPPAAPTVDLQFNGSNGPVSGFPQGSAGTLSWVVSNANTCTASGGTSSWNSPSSKVATNGTWSQSSGAVDSSTTFSISCTGDGGSDSDSVSVTVAGQNPPPAPPTVNLKFNNSDGPVNGFTSGSSGTLSWAVSNANTCTASGGTSSWSSPSSKTATNGTWSQSSGAINSSMTFNISCTGAGGTVNDSVSVNLADQPSICTDTNANNYGQPLPCTYSGATACTVSASPSSTANFPLNNVDVTVTVLNWDTTAHEYDVDCTNNGSYEETTYLTWTPHTFNNICSYSAPATLRGHVRNLATQATADCTTPITNSNRTLTASISSGSGTISGTGISCPTDCSEVYADGTNVTLTAAPAANYTFAGWSGACSGLSSCSVLMNQNRSVAASFTYSPFDYSLSNSGNSSVTKTSGNAYTQNVITKALVTGTTQAVTLSLSGVPGGTSYSISNGACSPNCNSTITFTVPPSTPAGTYPITVTGSPLNRTTSFNLIVSGAPISVSCLASPQTALLGQNVTWTVTVSGGTAPFTYAWSGTGIPTSPAPSSNPYTRTYSTIGLKSAQATVTDSDSIQSTCPAGTVMINFNPEFEEF